MPHGAVIAFAPLHFEGDFLLAAEVLEHFGLDRGVGDGWRAHRKLAFISDKQDALKKHRIPRFCLKTVHFKGFPKGDAVLLSTSF